MDDKIISFGKHKGKPVEILATDKSYTDWLLAQSWFKEQHLNVYNVVINNFREPVETPEHNKMQIKFLKKEHRLKLAFLLFPTIFDNNNEKLLKEMSLQINTSNYFMDTLVQLYNTGTSGLYNKKLLKLSVPVFEKVDVSFSIEYGMQLNYKKIGDYGNYVSGNFNFLQYNYFELEIKPTISEDFPAVLRQMKASMANRGNISNNSFVLLVGNYTGTSVTKDEFIEYFGTQGYKVVFEKDLENVVLPTYDTEFKFNEEIEEQIKQYIQSMKK